MIKPNKCCCVLLASTWAIVLITPAGWAGQAATSQEAMTPPSKVALMAVSPDAKTLYICRADDVLEAWAWESGKLQIRFAGKVSASALAVSSDGKLLASGSSDGEVQLWETAGGKEVWADGDVFRGHSDAATSLSFAAGVLLSGGYDGDVREWDVRDGELKREYEDIFGELAVGLSKDGETVVAVGAAGYTTLLNRSSGKTKSTFESDEGAERAAVISPDGAQVLLSQGAHVALFEMAKGKKVRAYGEKGDYGEGVQALAVSADWKVVVAGGRDGRVRAWNIASGEMVGQMQVDDNNLDSRQVTQVLVLPGEVLRVIVLTDRGDITLWNPKTGEKRSVDVSADRGAAQTETAKGKKG